jgi:hypothetical protein
VEIQPIPQQNINIVNEFRLEGKSEVIFSDCDRSVKNIGEHPNFAKIKFVVGASCSLMSRKRDRELSLQKNKFTHLGCSRI